MGDARLRDLERRWQRSRSARDEVDLLRVRVQVGDLDPARLELAAWLGHAGARAALGDSAPAGGEPMSRWIATVDADGRRALEQGARRGLELFASGDLEHTDDRAVQAIRDWVRDPCQQTLLRLGQTCEQLGSNNVLRRHLVDLGARPPAPRLIEWAHAIQLGIGLATNGPRSIANLLLGLPHTEESATPVFHWCLATDCSTTVVELGTNEVGDWLRTRMTRGELDRERLGLAAWAGDPRARRALRQPAHPDPNPRAWIEGLRQFPGQSRVVAGAAICAIHWPRIARAVSESSLPGSSQESLSAAIDRARQACFLPHRALESLGECALPFQQLGADPGTDAALAMSLRAVALALRSWVAPEGAVDALLALLPSCGEDVVRAARKEIRFAPLDPMDA